mgnify:CR=1 FL=1
MTTKGKTTKTVSKETRPRKWHKPVPCPTCGSRNISYDMVCRAMYDTGLNLSHQYKETSEGGLARMYDRRSTPAKPWR